MKYLVIVFLMIIGASCVTEELPEPSIVVWDRTTPENAVKWFIDAWTNMSYDRYAELLAKDFIFNDTTYPDDDTIFWDKTAELNACSHIIQKYSRITMTLTPNYELVDDNIEDNQGNMILRKKATLELRTFFYENSEDVSLVEATEQLFFIRDSSDTTLWQLQEWQSKAKVPSGPGLSWSMKSE
jgi:hypothetical protein